MILELTGSNGQPILAIIPPNTVVLVEVVKIPVDNQGNTINGTRILAGALSLTCVDEYDRIKKILTAKTRVKKPLAVVKKIGGEV